MQKTLPSQKILLSGVRIGMILHEGGVYWAYEKHWYFPRNTDENRMCFFVLFLAGIASGALTLSAPALFHC